MFIIMLFFAICSVFGKDGPHSSIKELISIVTIPMGSPLNLGDYASWSASSERLPPVLRNPSRALGYLTEACANGMDEAHHSLESLQANELVHKNPEWKDQTHTFFSTRDLWFYLKHQPADPGWVIFDVDYILLTLNDIFSRPKGQIICQELINADPQWSSAENKRRIVELMMCQSSYTLLDDEAPSFIHYLKQKKNLVLAITGMRENIQSTVNNEKMDALEWRINQLHTFGFSFGSSAPCDSVRNDWQNSGCCLNGIIRAGKNSKGDALRHYIDHVRRERPEKITFIDNNLAYLKSVRLMCKGLGIDFCGIHLDSVVRR